MRPARRNGKGEREKRKESRKTKGNAAAASSRNTGEVSGRATGGRVRAKERKRERGGGECGGIRTRPGGYAFYITRKFRSLFPCASKSRNSISANRSPAGEEGRREEIKAREENGGVRSHDDSGK